ncbi:hypothetical protein AV530_016418 [Patagioenas fasciata monilis]|uniref:Uncharacterized protein n=1 Tax=Patagioenas fasciata monilis TaxID=372326 RepID=A0A1V4JTP7_PATFA|nr:hypothetical protein AV530_016418 [Patagioenas fasciata monilis]
MCEPAAAAALRVFRYRERFGTVLPALLAASAWSARACSAGAAASGRVGCGPRVGAARSGVRGRRWGQRSETLPWCSPGNALCRQSAAGLGPHVRKADPAGSAGGFPFEPVAAPPQLVRPLPRGRLVWLWQSCPPGTEAESGC